MAHESLFSRKKIAFLVIAAAALVMNACSKAPDPTLDNLRALPVPPEKSRMIIMYPAPVMGSNGIVQIKWGDLQSCDLKSGTYVVDDVTPGDNILAFSFCGMSDVSRLQIKTLGGQKYYIRLLPYDSSLRGILSGYSSEFTSDGVYVGKGPFHFESVGEAQAIEMLGSLKAH